MKFGVTANISQRFLPLCWGKRTLVLMGILFLYLGSLRIGLNSVGPIQTAFFLLAYCTIGWHALKGSHLPGSKVVIEANREDESMPD